MSSPTDIPRVPPIFQNYEQLGDFVLPTSNCNSYKGQHSFLERRSSSLRTGEFCEGLIGNIPVAYSLPDSVVCQNCDNIMHDQTEMESNEDLKFYEQPLPTSGDDVIPILEPPNANRFRYTMNSNGILNERQRQFYEENGFLVIPKLISDEIIDDCQKRFLDIIDGHVPKGGITMMKDVSLKGKTGISNERIVNKIQDYVWDDVLTKHTMDPRMLDYAEAFTGPNIQAMHTMLINKPPDSGKKTSRHPLHQDLYYFPFRPADRIVCAWTAMERVDKENGCLVVLAGSHARKEGLLQHDYPEWEGGVNKMYHGVRDCDDAGRRTHLVMEKGDTVFFHPLLIHGSGMNKTNNFRKAISCHYADSNCYYIDVKGTIQEGIAKEVQEVAKRKMNIEVPYEEIWHAKSRIVRGLEGKL